MALEKKRALILSGGGGRGAYHCGVIEYLELIGWKPDVLVGTSIGAINAAAIASGEEHQRARITGNDELSRLALQVNAMLDGQAALDAISPTAAMPLSFPEQIEDGQTGILVSPGDVPDMVRAVRELLANSGL